jgi:hypothetical protein
MVGAPESRLLPTKIIIAFGLALRKGDSEPGANCSIPVATSQVREVREGCPLRRATQVWTCSSSPTSAAVRQLRSLAGLGNLSVT